MKVENLLVKYFIEYSAFALNTLPKDSARVRIEHIQTFLDTVPTCLVPDDVYLSERVQFEKLQRVLGYSNASVRWHVASLCAFWNWMKWKEYTLYNPFRGLKGNRRGYSGSAYPV